MLRVLQTTHTTKPLLPIVALIIHLTGRSLNEVAMLSLSHNFIRKNNKYYIGEKYPNVYFTRQEARYIYYAVKGLKNKEICEIMNITLRTCSWYCENIKVKINNIGHKKYLIKKIKGTDFMLYMDDLATQEEKLSKNS